MLPPNEIRKAAKKVRRLASDLERHAAEKEIKARHAFAQRRYRERRDGIIKIVASYLNDGMTPDQAIRVTAPQIGMDVDQLTAWLPYVKKEIEKTWRRRRDRKIVMLARGGYMDGEISAMTAHPLTGKTLHRKTINRIIRENWNLILHETQALETTQNRRSEAGGSRADQVATTKRRKTA